MEIKKNPLNLNNTTLSIRTIPNGFCFAVSEEVSKNLLYFAQEFLAPNENREDGLNNILNQYKNLKNTFKEVYWLVDNEKYFLIPTSIFDRDYLSSYWQLHFQPIKENESLRFDVIPASDMVIIYSIDKKLESTLQKRFPYLQTKHKQSIQIFSTLKKSRKSGQQLTVYLYNECFDAILIDNNRLILANSYSAKNENEFLYFLLNIFEQFKLDQYKTELNIYNSSFTAEKEISEIKKYINCVQILNETITPLEKKFMQSTDCVRQTTLLNLPLCV